MKTFNITSETDLTLLKDLDHKTNLMFCFGNNIDLIKKLQAQVILAKIVGCSSSGVISKNILMNPDENLIVNVLELHKTDIEVFGECFDDYDDSYACGQRLGKKISKREDLAGAIILTEGLVMNSSSFSVGLNSENPHNAPIMGGLAADNLTFTKTFVFDNKNIYYQSVIAVAFYGNHFHMKAMSSSGIKSFGVERRITKSVKNVVYEIDNKPALDVYESFLGREVGYQAGKQLNFPIEISENFETKEGLIRTPLGVDRENKTITFTSEIPENSTIRLMMAIKNDLIFAAENVDATLREFIKVNQIDKHYSFIVSCAARQIAMGEDVNMELPSNGDNQFGFYAYGEFSPVNTSCDLVNYTFTQGIIYEK